MSTRKDPALLLLICAPLALGCVQQLDTRAAAGSVAAAREGEDQTAIDRSGSGGNEATGGAPAPAPDAGAGRGAGSGGAAGAPGTGGKGGAPDAATDAGPPVAADPCNMVRSQARKVIETNCAPCHQAPAKQGNFDFCLDAETLIAAVSSTGKRFVVPGAPDESRLYQRASAGEMPPPGRMPRPSPADVVVLHDWIAKCLLPGAPGTGFGDPKPKDASPPTPADAGPPAPASDAAGPGDGCGKPGQSCCVANVCTQGGCCVFGRCRGPGMACGGAAGEEGDNGVPGTCQNGSCSNGGGVACGNVAQPCCGSKGTCTAPRAECMAGVTCQACGNTGQPCCGNGGNATCSEGLDCQGAGFGRIGICEPCGGLDQLCCGNGTAAQQTCKAPYTCRFVSGRGAICGV